MAKVSTKVLAVTLVVAIVTAGATFVLLTDVPATHSGRSDTLWKSEGPSLLAHVHISGTAPPQTSGLNTFLELTQQFSDVKSQLLCDALKQPKTVQSIAAEIDQGNEAVLQKIDDVIGKLTEYGFVDRIESD